MNVPSIKQFLDFADMQICEALEVSRRLSGDSTWQGCAETNEAEACRLRADLVELRGQLLALELLYFRS